MFCFNKYKVNSLMINKYWGYVGNYNLSYELFNQLFNLEYHDNK
ncbi:hypothetical protein SAMN05444338_111116 [Flavobacterium degerlachei]|jgi:hypothetical protein|uniref:Uncharacterized protein n=1 Tax=Flavobacterium degerlachei TaxID=229203 RepID=A0A1H3CHP7_9FLAO|nr:hypothetical protein SAMN05444338_111116 [Flavobacterium degerlachei]